MQNLATAHARQGKQVAKPKPIPARLVAQGIIAANNIS
jgi:hypothetical protein